MRCKPFLMATLAATMLAGILAPLRTTVVRGSSMEPNMRPGLYVLDTRYYRHHTLERGDVVVFRYRGETCTKRVFRLPGERVLLIKDDGDPQREIVDDWEVEALVRLKRQRKLPGRQLVEETVPAGHCFVVGDNRNVSWDSRTFGFLPLTAILGRVSL